MRVGGALVPVGRGGGAAGEQSGHHICRKEGFGEAVSGTSS